MAMRYFFRCWYSWRTINPSWACCHVEWMGNPEGIDIPIGSMVLVYMLTWMGYIDGKCYYIYIAAPWILWEYIIVEYDRYSGQIIRTLTATLTATWWLVVTSPIFELYFRSANSYHLPWFYPLVGVFFLPYIRNNNPNWLSYFSEGLKPPTSIHWWFDCWCYFLELAPSQVL